MPKYTNTKTGQVFNSPRPLTAEELQSVFSQAAPQDVRSPEAQKIDRPFTIGDELSRLGYTQIAEQPGKTFKQGVGESVSNPIAGAQDIGSSLLQAGLMPFSLAGQAAQNVHPILGFLAKALASPFTLSGQAVAPVTGAISGGLANLAGYSPEQIQEAQRAGGELGGLGGGLALGGPLAETAMKAPQTIGQGLRAGGQKIMGTALKAGENLSRAKELSKYATEREMTLTPQGSKTAGTVETTLKPELIDKILEPLTANRVTVDPVTARNALLQVDKEIGQGLPTGGQSFSNIIQRSIAELDAKIAQHPEGRLTPLEAQKYKEVANHVLDKFYKKQAAEGRPAIDTARMESLAAVNDALRSELENLHPEIKGINWERGSAIEVKKAIDQYLLQKYQGRGEASDVSAAFRIKPSKFSSFSVYDLLGSRSFRSKLAVLLDKAGRKLTGETPDIITGVKNPVQPNPPGTPPPEAPPPVGAIPRPQLPPGGPQEVSAPFTVEESRQLPPAQKALPGPEPPPTGSLAERRAARLREIPKPTPETEAKFQSEAQKYGITYDGFQGGIGPQFTDRSVTGSTYYLKPGETVGEALVRHRKEFYSK